MIHSGPSEFLLNMLSIIVAASENNVIGRDNQLVWKLPEDTLFFKNMTWGFPILMGRKSFEALDKKPLRGRFNIVITRNSSYDTGSKDVPVVPDLAAAIRLAEKQEAKEIFIGGGAEIYRESLPLCDRIYMTRVKTVIAGDAFFPEIPADLFELIASKNVPSDERNPFSMDFQTWQKKSGG